MANAISPTSAPEARASVAEHSRRWPTRALRAVAVLLILAGALTLIDGVVTLVWQEPISAIYASFRQDNLRGALRTAEHATPSAGERRALAGLSDERARVAYLAREFERHTSNGAAIGRIVIPRIGASYVVVKGTDTEDLKSGPGVYRETRFPGAAGTTAIAGHRTTYLAPFRHVDSLSPGDRILVYMPYAHFTYTVIGERVVEPTDVEAAIANVGYSRLVLSACTPLFSAAKRILVFAHLTRTIPAGAARWLPGGVVPRPIETSPRARAPRPLPAMLKSLDPNVLTPRV
jgi:sortase A